jgi:hypothetical protein
MIIEFGHPKPLSSSLVACCRSGGPGSLVLGIVPGKEEPSVSDSIADDVESQVPPSCQQEDGIDEAFDEPAAFLAHDERGRSHCSDLLAMPGVGAFADGFVWVLVSQIGETAFV